jgi:hypothetical protein
MALNGEWPLYGLNPEIKETWLKKWGRKVSVSYYTELRACKRLNSIFGYNVIG